MARANKGLGSHYDKLLLVLMIFALLGSVGWMFTGGGGFGFDPGRGAIPDGKPAQEYPIEELAATWVKHVTPESYTYTNRVLSSEIRVMCVNTNRPTLIRMHAENCPFCGVKQPKRTEGTDSDSDGIPDLVEIAASMDPYDAADASWDCDKDGYTALEEFLFQRPPEDGAPKLPDTYNFDDPENHPPHLERLRTARIINRPLKFELKRVSEIEEGVFSFQVTIIDGKNKYLKIGATYQGYTLKKYDQPNQTLHIDGPTGPLALPRGKAVEVPQRVAALVVVANTGEKPVTVRIGDTFTVEGEEFKVTDIKESAVVAESAKSGAITIGQITPEEFQLYKDIASGNFLCEAGASDSGGK